MRHAHLGSSPVWRLAGCIVLAWVLLGAGLVRADDPAPSASETSPPATNPAAATPATDSAGTTESPDDDAAEPAETTDPARHERRRARDLATEGLGHCQSGDLDTCRQKLRDAIALWDGHYQFAFLLAQVEARSGQHQVALERITALSEAGYALPLAEDPAFEALRDHELFRQAVARIERFADRPVVRGEVFAELGQRDLIPEGVVLDPATGDLYVSSIRHRKIVRRQADGRVADFATQDLYAVFGLALDPRRGWLWATTGAVEAMTGFTPESDGRSALVAYSLEDGREVARHRPDRGDGPGQRLNDLALDATGQVFTTDNRLDGRVWKLTTTGTFEPLTAPGVLRSPQGITFDSHGRLFVADYSFGLARVDPDDGQVTFLDAPDAVSLIGVDGLTAHSDTLIAVQNGARPIRVLRLHLDDTAHRVTSVEILEMGHPRWSEPTLGTVVDDHFHYVANSQWDRFDAEFGLPPIEELAGPLILRLDLR